MGNCTGKGSSNDVAQTAGDTSAGTTPEHPPSSRAAQAAELDTPRKHKKNRRSSTGTTTNVNTPAPAQPVSSNGTPQDLDNKKKTGSSNNDTSTTDNNTANRHHHRRHRERDQGGTPAGEPKASLPPAAAVAPAGKDEAGASSQSPSAAQDSIAARLEQGSTYIWLRNTFSNPHLRPTPLLTFDCLRHLRNKNVAFQRLWSVLGEAACVIGPYAANPTPAPLSHLAEEDDEGEAHAEPSFVNDEAQLAVKKGRAKPGALPVGARGKSATSPTTPATAGTPTAAVSAGVSGGSAPEVKEEVRMLNQQHISIEGEDSQRHPIVCRGAVYRGRHIWIHKMRSRCCFVFEPVSGVDLHDCSDALIVLSPTSGAVSLSNCQRCLIVSVAGQLRVLSCTSLVLSVNVAGFPVIEKSTNIGLAPLLGWYAYSRLPLDFQQAHLSLFTNNYSTVRDVTPPATTNANAANNLSISGSSGTHGAANAKGSHTATPPTSNFVYVDLWELEAAVWKAMAEQRWSQLIADADVATATAAAAAAAGGGAGGEQKGHESSDDMKEGGHAASGNTSRPFLTALTPAESPLRRRNSGGDADGDDLSFPARLHNDDDDEDKDEDANEVRDANDASRTHNTSMPADGTFHSMISFGRFTPSTLSKTHVKGGSPTTASGGEVSQSSPHQTPKPSRAVPTSVWASSTSGDSAPPLPRWRQSGFSGNVATDGTPMEENNTNNNNNNKHQKDKRKQKMNPSEMQQLDLARRRRGSAREAEHLVREVLRTVPLLPLSALRDAPSLLLEGDSVDGKSSAASPQAAKEKAMAEERRAARCNPLELALATYTHTCAAPATFGAQLIPADFFEQAWKLKLMVLTTKSGGYDLARRIVRDIEGSRRCCFLETVRAMLHAPPPSMRVDTDKKKEGAASCSSSNGSSVRDGAMSAEEEEEDTFSEALWHYLHTTSLTQRCGSVLLLNMVELRCTETAVREFVAPVFYKLCEPVGQKSSAATSSAAATTTSGGSRGLHLPWKSSNAHASSSSEQQQQQQPEVTAKQQEHNVEMRRLFGTAIQRMTGQTCIVMLALMAPKSVPQSFQRPASAGGRSTGGALTPAELDAWARRADQARSIFTPQKDPSEGHDSVDGHGGKNNNNNGRSSSSTNEPTAAEEKEATAGDAAKEKKPGPTFAPLEKGDAPPQTLEERVWPQSVLLNVTVPMRFVSLLQGSLFFKSQMHVATAAGGPPAREPEFLKKN